MPELHPAIQAAPVALVRIDADDRILQLNDAAALLGLSQRDVISDFLPGIDEPFALHLRHQPAPTLYRLVLPHSEKRIRATWVAEEGGVVSVWMLDMTEQLAIAERSRKDRQPLDRQLRRLNQLAVTASGYAELLDVVMEDGSLAADRLNTLKQYQEEVSRNLAAMLEVLRGDSQPSGKAGTIIVADGHKDLANLISELLRTEGYRAESFCDAASVLQYLRVNGDSVVSAIIDEELRAGDELLINAVRPLRPSLEVIALSSSKDALPQGKLGKPVDFQALLQLMQQQAG